MFIDLQRPLQNGTFRSLTLICPSSASCLNLNPQNTQCLPPVNPPQADRLPPLKVRDLRLELEQKLLFFKGLLFQKSLAKIPEKPIVSNQKGA